MFQKTATIQVTHVVSGTWDGGKLVFSKTAQQMNSHYQSGVGIVDVKGILDIVSKEYSISDDPANYVYEVVRAVTAEVSNQNGDAFARSELLRYDHRLAKAVYQTFIGKGHFINHRTTNPKTARGVILDAHYNDLEPAKEYCPQCNVHTAAVENRDASGIHCGKCGAVVKDEFVELLLAIDSSKDKNFAAGVKAGTLSGLSMGCFVPGTQVLMSDGTTKSIELIRSGDYVRTHGGNVTEVTDVSVRHFKEDVITLDVAGEEDITLTPNHPVWVINQETRTGEWIHAEHITKGMYVLSPKIKTTYVDVDIAIARLAGYFVSEGNYIKGYDKSNLGRRVGIEFTFNISEDKYVNEVQHLLSSLGYDSNRYDRKDRNTSTVKAYRCESLANRLFELVGEHAHSKILSEEILNWNSKSQLAFIGAWLNGDGHSLDYKNVSRSVFVTVSRDLASQLSQILINNDIINRIQVRELTSGFGSLRPAYDVIITGDSQVRLAAVSDKVKRAIRNTDNLLQSKITSGGLARLVKRVKRIPYDGKVYNFEVLHGDHSYIAGGVGVHNCECAYTVCSICDNVARSVSEFCTHIRGGNKKKTFKTASGPKMSFEWCKDVIFTEISRVDQPADPTAVQKEVFKVAATDYTLWNIKPEEISVLRSHVVQKYPDKVDIFDRDPVDFINKYNDIALVLRSIRQLGYRTTIDPVISQQKRHMENLVPGTEMHSKYKPQYEDNINRLQDASHTIKNVERLKQLIKDKVYKKKSQFSEDLSMVQPENPGVEQVEDADLEEILNELEKIKDLHPQLYLQLTELLDPDADDVPEEMSFDDYTKRHDEESNTPSSLAELGIKDEEGGIPRTVTSKKVLRLARAELDALINLEVRKVATKVPDLKFANAYASLRVAVTDQGNVRVFTPAGTLFVIRPDQKPADKVAADQLSREIITQIGTFGIVDTMRKFKATHAPKIAQVLADGIVDFDGGRKGGDEKAAPEGGEGDIKDKRESPAKDSQAKADDDKKPEPDSPPKSVQDDHAPDHVEKAKSQDSVLSDPESDMAEERAKKTIRDTLLDEIALDFKSKGKKASVEKVAEVPDFLKKKDEKEDDKEEDKKEAAAPEEKEAVAKCSKEKCEDEKCAAHGKKAQLAPPEKLCEKCLCQCGCPCGEMVCACKPGMCQGCDCVCAEGDKSAQGVPAPMGAPAAVPAAAPAPAVGGMPAMASLVKEAADKHVSRLERLYKTRLEQVKQASAQKTAEAEKVAFDKVSAKLMRTLKLAATRQALNLEASPLKEHFADVLLERMDLDSETMYPGMDADLATRLIEAAVQKGFDPFVESLVKRASEFMGMNEETLSAIEADVKHLQTITPVVTAHVAKSASSNDSLKKEAEEGNMIVAPAAGDENVSSDPKRENIRQALGTTKVYQAKTALLNKIGNLKS